jgi:hypothetical protein
MLRLQTGLDPSQAQCIPANPPSCQPTPSPPSAFLVLLPLRPPHRTSLRVLPSLMAGSLPPEPLFRILGLSAADAPIEGPGLHYYQTALLARSWAHAPLACYPHYEPRQNVAGFGERGKAEVEDRGAATRHHAPDASRS